MLMLYKNCCSYQSEISSRNSRFCQVSKLPIFQIFLKLLNLYNCWVTWDPHIEIFEFLTPFAFSQLFVFLHLGSLCQVLTWHMYWKRMIELWEPFLTHAKAHELLLVPMIGLQPLDLSPKKQWNNDYICQMHLLFVIYVLIKSYIGNIAVELFDSISGI